MLRPLFCKIQSKGVAAFSVAAFSFLAILFSSCETTSPSATKGSASGLSWGFPKGLPDKKGLLWEVRKNSGAEPSYLFGTMHIVCQNDLFPAFPLVERLAKAKKLIIETTDQFDDPVMASQWMGTPENFDLRTYFSDEEWSKIKQTLLNPYRIDIEKFRNLHPFFLTSVISTRMLPQCASGPKTPISYESWLTTNYGSIGHSQSPIGSLETSEEALRSIGLDMDANEMAKELSALQSLNTIKNSAIADLKNMTRSYFKDDLNEIRAHFMKDNPRDHFGLLFNRNEAWMEKIPGELENGPVFIAVGAAHLIGSKGLLGLLLDAGYDLKSIPIGVSEEITPAPTFSSAQPKQSVPKGNLFPGLKRIPPFVLEM